MELEWLLVQKLLEFEDKKVGLGLKKIIICFVF